MTNLHHIESVPATVRDRGITAGGRISQVQAECIVLADRLSIAQVISSTLADSSIKISGGVPEQLVKPFFKICELLV